MLQIDELEEGVACLGMVLGYYKKWLSLNELRAACGFSRDGILPGSIERAATGYGLDCRCESLTFEQLREKGGLPAIVVWDNGKYVVYRGFNRKGVWINHPGRHSVPSSALPRQPRVVGS